MSDHLTNTQIKDYGLRLLPAAEWLFVSDHLAVCELCRRQVEAAVNGEAAYYALKSGVLDEIEAGSSVAESAHLSFAQLTGLIDGSIANKELRGLEEHVSWCEECEAAVDDLRAFKDQIAPELGRRDQRLPVGVASEGRWQRLMAALRPKSPVLVFGACLAMLLLAVGWLSWRALPGMRVKPEVAMTSPSPGASPTVLPESTPESAMPAAEAAVIIARLNDGEGQITLDEEQRLSGIDHLPAAYQRLVKKALTDQKIERSKFLAESSQSGFRSRGEANVRGAKFSVLEPAGIVTFSDHPTFRWTQLDGATSYVVEVYDERFNSLVTSPQLTGHSWTAPQSLKRGGTYYWQVKAIKDGEEFKAPRAPEPQAKFRIVDEATANELAKARRAYGSSHLTLGLLYAQAGLLGEAEEEFQALMKNNPDSELAERLLKQVRTKP